MSKHVHPRHHDQPECLPLPRFERVKYFYGQLLGVREFQSEQAYFLEKHRLHNRYLHGYGVVCGLEVQPCKTRRDPCDPPERPDPKPKPEDKPREHDHDRDHDDKREQPCEVCVEIDCGLALDCCGNEIIVPWPAQIDLLRKLECDDRETFLRGRMPAYISICFHERPIDPVRPITADHCGGMVPDCLPSRLRDDFCITVSL